MADFKKMFALTRAVGNELVDCELSFVDREPLDVGKAKLQHNVYVQTLHDLGVEVTVLPAEAGMPDGVFVEDAAVVVDEVAVITRIGAESRRGEAKSVAAVLSKYRTVEFMNAPATLDGGDVMRVENKLFVGESARTNGDGIGELRRILSPLGYEIFPVTVTGCLHFKTACTYLGDNVLLANPDWTDLSPFKDFGVIHVDSSEPFAANSLRINDTVLYPNCFPKTQSLIEARGINVKTLGISELQKAEAGLTCLSIVFSISSAIQD